MDSLALENQVCFALTVATRHVVGLYRPLLAEVNLTHPQYLVLVALWQHGPLSVRRLGDLLHLDSGTLSPLVKRLEAAHYLRRERDPADERKVIITVTSEGEALRRRVEPMSSAAREHLGLSAEDTEQLQAVLSKLTAVSRFD
ncbi:MarR family winged helix-turn-helix transcriptional regulator [Paractinoplanes brasiliensis]|uniref:DNA-binding MarR family transcriptional regulator n=1 Tax=Paractinoplanes brasiliensis TaxID=52695 RepID=A0A4R6JQ96_9ACTN|nr:MarR family transcriptional regulator [Actinoplanes brasiliensis]TDO37026.1 DNA-binding MarR family transcriptional regulator [Actinoplanes brasiliensis]GID32283.1 MarR family transcriptional regulator [Actinoplanes brasiliensis]